MFAKYSGVVRNNEIFAGKPIYRFDTGFRPSVAVKVFTSYNRSTVVEQLEELAKSPAIRQLDTLVIGKWSWNTTPKKVLDKLIELKAHFSGLRHLFIGDMHAEELEMSWIKQMDYSGFYQHFSTLESFGVRGGKGLILGQINLPNLKNLIIETGGLNADVINDIYNSNLPNLKHLELWLGAYYYGCTVEVEQLQAILDGKFSDLKYLGLKNYEKQDELIQKLQGASILNDLDTLDVSMGILTDKGAEALYNNNALLRLQHINCRYHYISDEWKKKLKTKFAKQNINLDDQADSEDGTHYYVAIDE